MKMKKITFQGWKNCIELTNGDFRIVVTTEIGPRIVGAFLGPKGANLLYLDKKLLGTSAQKVWTNYGGHRIWHAPEDSVRSYCPDSRKVVTLGADLNEAQQKSILKYFGVDLTKPLD